MKKLLIVMMVLMFSGQAWTATYYVSQSAANGYAVGNDSNTAGQAISKSTPWLTWGRARIGSSAGDTIIFNDGTYLTTDGANGTTSMAINQSLSVLSENPGMVIIHGTNTTQTLEIVPASDSVIVIGAIVVDAQNTANRGITLTNTAFTLDVTLNGTQILNPTTYGLHSQETALNITVNNASISIANQLTGGRGINMVSLSSGNVAIDGLVLNTTGNIAGTLAGVTITSTTGTGSTVSINNVTGSVTNTNAGGAVVGVAVRNVPSAIIDHSNVIVTGINAGVNNIGLQISADTTLSANGSIIRNSTATLNAPSGYAIIIGDSSASGSGTAHNGKIYGCTANGVASGTIATPHGIVMGMGNSVLTTGGEVYNNISNNLNPAYLAAKCAASTTFHNNIASNSGIAGPAIAATQILYSKGCTGTKWFNNTVRLTGFNAYALAVRDHGDGTHNTGVEYRNNIVYTDSSSAVFETVTTSNTATPSNNLYFAPSTLGATAWNYQGTNYNTFVAWQAVETSGALFADPLLSASYHLLPGSPAIGAGSNTPITGILSLTDPDGHPMTGIDGSVFSRWISGIQKDNVDMGAHQYSSDTLSITSTGAAIGGYFNAGHPYAVSLPDSPAGYSAALSTGVVTLTGPLQKNRVKVRLTDGVGSTYDKLSGSASGGSNSLAGW
jgi:hypothetical protein